MKSFRVHFSDGTKIDVRAEDAKGAQAEASKRHTGHVTKIKVIRS